MKNIEELRMELLDAKEHYASVQTEFKEAKKLEDIYNLGRNTGTEMSALIKGLIDGGLTEKQAFELIKAGMIAQVK